MKVRQVLLSIVAVLAIQSQPATGSRIYQSTNK